MQNEFDYFLIPMYKQVWVELSVSAGLPCNVLIHASQLPNVQPVTVQVVTEADMRQHHGMDLVDWKTAGFCIQVRFFWGGGVRVHIDSNELERQPGHQWEVKW